MVREFRPGRGAVANLWNGNEQLSKDDVNET
jgi:hypothetical protein